MSWEDLKPSPKKSKAFPTKDLTVMVSSNGAGRSFWHWLQITVRPVQLREYPTLNWLAPSARVNVQLGSGDQARRVRIFKGRDFQFSKVAGGGTPIGEICHIRLPALPEQLKAVFATQEVAWQVVDGALIVTLPAWCFGQLGEAGKGAWPVGGALTPPMHVRAPTLPEQARRSLLPPAISAGEAGAAAAPAQGVPYKLGAPSHAQVNKMRGVPGAD